MSKESFFHYRLTFSDQPSLTQNEAIQRHVFHCLLRLRQKYKAKVLSFFCEHFQFHFLLQMPEHQRENFEANFLRALSPGMEGRSSCQLQFRAHNKAAFHEDNFLDLRKWCRSLLDRLPPPYILTENSKAHLHRFQIQRERRTFWPTKRSLMIASKAQRSFFKNPMKLRAS